MAGAAAGNMGAVVLALFGLVVVVRARRRGKRPQEADPVADKRMAERLEMERRMAAYLRSRDQERG